MTREDLHGIGVCLVHFMVATGLSMRDLSNSNVGTFIYSSLTQSTEDGEASETRRRSVVPRPCSCQLQPKELLLGRCQSADVCDRTLALPDLRQVMKDASLWIKGALAHRFRDTAVDFWLGAGCSMTEIASLLGDSVSVVERHYADLASKRMEDRLANVPTRSWGKV